MKAKTYPSLPQNKTLKTAMELDHEVVSAMLYNSDMGFMLVDDKGAICAWNRWLERMSGIPAKEAIGTSLQELFPKLKNDPFIDKIQEVMDSGMPRILAPSLHPHILPLYKNRSDRHRDIPLEQMVMIKRINKNPRYGMIEIMDVSASAARDQQLREQSKAHRKSELHTRAILSSIADAVITTDPGGHIDYINKVAESLTGWTLDEARGKPVDWVFNVIDEPSQRPIIDLVHSCLKDGQMHWTRKHELVLIRRDGVQCAIEESLAPIRDIEGEVLGAVVIFRDVTKARKMAAQISWQATHDVLTELDNRLAFEQQLELLLETSKREKTTHALLYLDLDQFKIVNDTCGHVAGDELLRQVSELLRQQMREQDLLARLGGDEFGVILRNCPQQPAVRIANEIRKVLQEFRFGWDDKSFAIGVSIGVVGVDQHSESLSNLLSAADTACYAAKEGGRNQVHLFQLAESAAAERHGEMQWVSRIQHALDEERFRLYIQPICSVEDITKIDHSEILVRMLDEEGHLIPPGAFIPAAERFNLMPAIDRWVIHQVMSCIATRMSQSETVPMFSVNLSGATINDDDSLDFIHRELSRFNIPPGSVCFEITETAAIANLASANRFIGDLKQSGCSFSLDDFGSGLSSFAYLKNLPVDFLKIDGAFVKDMVEDPIDRSMVEAINQIGHVMGLRTIAEFVERDEVLTLLKDIGVDFAQGFGVAKPEPLKM